MRSIKKNYENLFFIFLFYLGVGWSVCGTQEPGSVDEDSRILPREDNFASMERNDSAAPVFFHENFVKAVEPIPTLGYFVSSPTFFAMG
jgi:hypothetical protein